MSGSRAKKLRRLAAIIAAARGHAPYTEVYYRRAKKAWASTPSPERKKLSKEL